MSTSALAFNIYSDLQEELLAAAADCLDAYSPSGVPAARFISIGDPIYVGCDYLAVWSPPHYPTASFPDPAPPARQCDPVEWVFPMVLKLIRCGYPRLNAKAGGAQLPQAAELTDFTRGLNTDARIVECCLQERWRAGELFTNPNLPAGVPLDVAGMQVQWGLVSPYRAADLAGFSWAVTVAVPPCCDLPPVESGE